GLQFHRAGHRCEAHQYLGLHCRHVFLNCCKQAEGTQTVRDRPALDPTLPPATQTFNYPCAPVSDSLYPKEAFSIGEERDGENAVEGPVEDRDECLNYGSNICNQRCNTPGSYECSCTSGFRLSADGKSCEDVNECLTSQCSQECANIYGSYQCYCRKGYYLREDRHTCEDIDECSQSIGHLCAYRCVNTPGDYQCACPEYGYAMSPNGRSCRDIDECATGTHNCSLGEKCYNIQGGYRCLSLNCPPNYRKISECYCSCPNYLQCQNSPQRITYYYLSFQSNIVIPAQIFRIGPAPAYSGDNVIVTITEGNEESYFSTRKLNAYTGAVFLQRQVQSPRDFLITVEMKLWRQGKFATFQARLYIFITPNLL
uniref:Fibulin 2 n=1 Tax=Poecilia reticulata TaxID=8081 RepID=A0A3P9NVR6_POERE